jgi:DNA-binding CsgD family transcriptional regulator
VSIDRVTGVMSGVHLPEPIPEVIALMLRDLSEVPLVDELARGTDRLTLRISDVIAPDVWAASTLCRDVYRPWGGEHQIGSLIARDPGVLDALAVFRSERDFTEREVAVVEGLARLIRVAAERIRRHRSGVELLTPRQRQVLAELESGATNREAAWRLGIAEKTLEHHLVAIYRRLGVSSRAAALHRLRGRPAGSPVLADGPDAA